MRKEAMVVRALPTHSPAVEALWTAEDTAAFLGVPVATLYQWRHHRKGPSAYRVGRWLRYDPVAVRAWLSEQIA